jgi:hypothetical protein
MKTISKINVLTILIIVFGCSHVPSDESDYELDMSNVKKKVSIMIYEAVTNRGHIAQGNIWNSASGSGNDYYFSYSDIYYDENNNELYEEYYREERMTPYRTVKTNWYNSKEGQKQSIYQRHKYEENADYYYGFDLYERNNNGNLIQISDSKNEINATFKYDSNGNRTEEIEYESKYNTKSKKYERVIKLKTLYSNFNSNGKFQRKLVYNSNNQLMEDVVVEFPNFNSVIEYSKYYKYDQLTGDMRSEFIYNRNNLTVIRRMGEEMDAFVGYPSDLYDEEQIEAYIKEKYYGSNLKLRQVEENIERLYDSYDNLIEVCFYQKNNPYRNFFQNSPCEKIASYKYNEHGDWVEMVRFRAFNEPSHIIVRNIQYF